MNDKSQPFSNSSILHNIQRAHQTGQTKTTYQADLFPSDYWKNLSFVQRTLLVEQINRTLNTEFMGYCAPWDELPAYFRKAVIEYIENDHKPIVFISKGVSE